MKYEYKLNIPQTENNKISFGDQVDEDQSQEFELNEINLIFE